MHEFLKFILSYQEIVLIGASLFTFVVTQVLKLPIKHFTGKIKDDKVRKMVNTTIVLLPFIFGCIYEALYSHCYLHEAFSFVRGLTFGMSGISAYAFVERFLGVKKTTNIYETTDNGKAAKELIEKVTADGKIDANDISAVGEFLKKVK